jgi:hypothetical protein
MYGMVLSLISQERVSTVDKVLVPQKEFWGLILDVCSSPHRVQGWKVDEIINN